MKLTRTELVGAVAAVGLVVPATALAATIDGGPTSEYLRGTSQADTINGNGGPGDDTMIGDNNDTGDLTSFDRMFGAAGNDTMRGGDSADRMSGGSGNDRIFGENGRDRMSGGSGDDAQDGGPGDDTIFANH